MVLKIPQHSNNNIMSLLSGSDVKSFVFSNQNIASWLSFDSPHKQTHSFEIQFVTPFVGDTFEWNVKGQPKKGYVVGNGEKNIITYLNSVGQMGKKKKII